MDWNVDECRRVGGDICVTIDWHTTNTVWHTEPNIVKVESNIGLYVPIDWPREIRLMYHYT